MGVSLVKRLEALAQSVHEHKIDKFIITNIFNVRYLSNFSGSTAVMIVDRDSAVLVTDFRYKEQAEGEVYRGVEVRIDTRDALTAVMDMLSEVGGRVGFEAASMTYGSYEKLKDKLKAEVVPIDGAVEGLRKAKDDSEIATIAKAVEIADAVFGEIVGEIKPGMTEVDLAARIDFLLRKKSSEVPSFETIVASGEHASLPHAKPTQRVIREGDLVKMDFGAIWDGYCSDLTRTVVVGKASEKVREVYEIVRTANERAVSGTRAGVKGSEVDALARDYITEKGYGENFGHGLGHGVGLEVHEEPRLSKKNDKPLEPGAVVTVEPGIYIPGWGGVRIEDMVVVEEDGCRLLTSATRDLLEVGA
jgi:Xaa-Pro aminopeptidase